MTPIPAAYATLGRWLPSLSARAAALGLSRQTLTTWERREARPAVRTSTATAIERLAAVADLAERRIGDPAGVGRWLLAPQPSLGGSSAAALLRGGDARGWTTVRRLLAPLPEPDVHRVAFDALRAAADDLDRRGLRLSAPRRRPRAAGEAILLRRAGVPPDLIGPVLDAR